MGYFRHLTIRAHERSGFFDWNFFCVEGKLREWSVAVDLGMMRLAGKEKQDEESFDLHPVLTL